MPIFPNNFSDGDVLPAASLNDWKEERENHILPINGTTKEYAGSAYDIGSNTYKWRHGYFSGNITGTLATAAQPNITSVGTLTGLTTNEDLIIDKQSGINGYQLSQRSGVTSFPVAVIRANQADVGVLDICPNGSPPEISGNGFAWLDVCDTDVKAGTPPVGAARVGILGTHIEFGSRAFDGGTLKPLKLTMGGTGALTIDTSLGTTIHYGLNLGTATGATAGQIKTSSYIYSTTGFILNAGGAASDVSIQTNIGGAGKAGIDFGSGSAARDTNLYRDSANVLKTDDSLVVGGSLTGTTASFSGIVTANGGIDAGGNGVAIKCKIIEIGDWDMDSTAFVDVTTGINRDVIRTVYVHIYADTGASVYSRPLDYPMESDGSYDVQGTYWIADGSIRLRRKASGEFDSTYYDSTSYNRGWVTIWYTE